MNVRHLPRSSSRPLVGFARCRSDDVPTLRSSAPVPTLPLGKRSVLEATDGLPRGDPATCRNASRRRSFRAPPQTDRLDMPASASGARDTPPDASERGHDCAEDVTRGGRGCKGNEARCGRCGSPNLNVVRCTSGMHYASIRCTECGAVTWAKKPWTLERALAWVLPFGKYRGRKLADLTGTDEGRGYLGWLATRDAGNASIAARLLVDHVENPSSDVSPAHERARRLRNAGPPDESTVRAVGLATGSTVLTRSTIDAPQS
jgi:uncharacterized protein (DUF3820 family)